MQQTACAMKKILSITSLVFLLTACGGKQEKAENTVVELTPPYKVEIPASISATVDSVFPLSEVASDVEFVQLEVTDESLLREIYGIKVSDSHILIHDINQVYLFARDGKFLTRVGSQGQGPSEYLHVDKVMLDEKRQEIIVSTTTTGIKVYGLDGKYKKTIPNTKLENLFGGCLQTFIYQRNNDFLLRAGLPLVAPVNEDVWTWALVDSNFQFIKKYYNPEVIKRKDELNKQVGNLFGEPKWGEGSKNLKDFYAGDFTMSFGLSDAILKFDTTQLTFNALYNFHFEKKVPFEMAAQWGKLDDRVFDYYILCDYLLSKDYLNHFYLHFYIFLLIHNTYAQYLIFFVPIYIYHLYIENIVPFFLNKYLFHFQIKHLYTLLSLLFSIVNQPLKNIEQILVNIQTYFYKNL